MEIKTIWCDGATTKFDDQVNKALKEGWSLKERKVLIDPDDLDSSILYAELEKYPEPEAPDLDEAIKALAHACKSAPACGEECPLNDWCQRNLPDTRYAPQDWIEET